MKRIFLVEDNEDHALLIQRALEDGDVAVTHYSDGSALFESADDAGGVPGVDLILLDLNLPGMDGFEVLANLKNRKAFQRIPVVILTTSCRPIEIEKAYQLGVSGFVVKSDDFSELTAKLKRLKDYWFHTVELPNGCSAQTRQR